MIKGAFKFSSRRRFKAKANQSNKNQCFKTAKQFKAIKMRIFQTPEYPQNNLKQKANTEGQCKKYLNALRRSN